MSVINVGDSQTFSYTGNIQTFTAEVSGLYKLEVYGAQGGAPSGGQGGYSAGYIVLQANSTVYVCVGGQGGTGNLQTTLGSAGGYNGGGAGGGAWTTEYYNGSGGGGATHIATVTGTLATIGASNLSQILIIAGGGGGYGRQGVQVGTGGGLTGGIAKGVSSVATIDGSTQTDSGVAHNTNNPSQIYATNRGTFGQGGNGRQGGNNSYASHGCGGGGGGLYGGSAMAYGTSYTNCGGAGGSGYIDGVPEIVYSGTTYTPSTTNGVQSGNGSATITLIAVASSKCRIKVNGTWVNGTPYIKVNGSWVEGKPYIKVNGQWKEGI